MTGYKLDLWVKTFCLLFIVQSLWAQSVKLVAQTEYTAKTFTIENGLPYNQITSINQDKNGFLWIGTWDGLSRFDGYEFRNYYHRPEDSSSLAYFSVEKILVDRNNQIFIDCGIRPISIYDGKTDKFNILKINGITDYDWFDFTQGIDQRIWAINDEFIFLLDDSMQIERRIAMKDQADQAFAFTSTPQLAMDNHNSPWLFMQGTEEYTAHRGWWINDTIIQWQPVKSIPIGNYTPAIFKNNDAHFRVFVTDSGRIMLFSKFDLFEYDDSLKEFRVSSAAINPGELLGTQDFIWGTEQTGLNIINMRTKEHLIIKQLPNTISETAFLDSNGVIWSGTTSDSRDLLGLTRYIHSHRQFKHYLTGKDENGQILLVFPVQKDKFGTIWAGTREPGRINRISPDGQVEKIDFSAGLTDPSELMARTLVEDESGMWIGCAGSYLFFYDYLSGCSRAVIDSQPVLNGIASPLQIHNILNDNSHILINGHEGIYRVRKADGEIRHVFKTRYSGTSHCFMPDCDNGYWLGTWNNTVINLDADFKEIKSFKLGTGQNLVEHICLGDSNDIWVALMGGGLGHLYPETGKYEFFTTADGLSNNVLYSILKDSKGNLWIATNQGLTMFNPKTRFFRRFGKEDGLLIQEFNSDSWHQSKSGEIYFGGVGGFVGFSPDSLQENIQSAHVTPLVITNFKVSGAPIQFHGDINQMDTLILPKGANNFQIAFALLDFSRISGIRYHYRLIGQNSDWIETGPHDRNISFVNLSHQDYQLVIEATDQRGNWTFSKSLVIRIPDRFVETTWFKLITGFLAVSVFFIWILIYFRQEKIKTRQQQDELRLESLRGQMNPHFIFNSLNSINYFISKNDKLSANHFISDFSSLIRSILRNLSANYIAFEREIKSLEEYLKLEHLRFGDRFTYSIDAGLIENQSDIQITPGIIQPFVENAIWHGLRCLEDRVGRIRLEFAPAGADSVLCTITDDGIGRKLSAEFKSDLPGKKSQGILIVQERLKIIGRMRNRNYTVRIEDLFPDQEETGTRVTIEVPAQTENWKI